jgi:hypothetical protein
MMKHWFLLAIIAAAWTAVFAPASAQAPARFPDAQAAASDFATGQSGPRRTSAKSRKPARRTGESSRPSAPPSDLPPGYHKVDHQTGLPNPSIPSR